MLLALESPGGVFRSRSCSAATSHATATARSCSRCSNAALMTQVSAMIVAPVSCGHTNVKDCPCRGKDCTSAWQVVQPHYSLADIAT